MKQTIDTAQSINKNKFAIRSEGPTELIHIEVDVRISHTNAKIESADGSAISKRLIQNKTIPSGPLFVSEMAFCIYFSL